MNRLPAGTFQEIVDAGGDEQVIALLIQMDEAAVGVDDLLQVDGLAREIGERIFVVVLLVKIFQRTERHAVLQHDSGEDTASEISVTRDEEDIGIEARLLLMKGSTPCACSA